MREQVRKLIDDNDRRLVSPADGTDGTQGVVPCREGQSAAGHFEVLACRRTNRVKRLGSFLLECLVVEAADRLGEATQKEGLALSASPSDLDP